MILNNNNNNQQQHTPRNQKGNDYLLLDNAKRYMYGIDLASGSGGDYTGIVIHSLDNITKEEPRPLPRLTNLYQEKMDFTHQLDFLNEHLFPKYPPYHMVFDYTNEKSFTDMMIRDYGADMVEGIIFGAGLSGTKKMLKDDGAFILMEGYQFPNVTQMKNPAKAELVKTLIEELRHEEMKLTPTGRESFDHPRGKNNDMAHAWEMSIHACIRFMLNAGGEPVTTGGHYQKLHGNNNSNAAAENKINPDLLGADDQDIEQYLPKYETPDDLIPELTGSSRYKITGTWSVI